MHQAAAAISAPAQPELSPFLPAGRRRSRTLARLLVSVGSLLPLACTLGGTHPAAIAASRGAMPGLIAAGPDGAVWVAERNRPRLDRIAADGTVSEFALPFSIGGGALIAAPDGALWAAVGTGVARISTDGATRMIHIPSAFESVGDKGDPKTTTPIAELAPGPLGTVWYTMPGSGCIGRIVGGTDAGTLYLGAHGHPTGLANAHFATWFSDVISVGGISSLSQSPGFVGRLVIEPSATVQFYTGHDRITAPAQMGIGPDGNAWFEQGPSPADLSGPDRLSRILDDGRVTDYPLPAGEHPGRFVSGPDTALWYTIRGAARVGKLSMDGTVREYPLPAGSGPAAGIAAGTDGNLWLSLPASRQIGRLSPSGTVSLFRLPA